MELKLGGDELFRIMKMLYKFHIIWMNQSGTSFTQHPFGHNLRKIAEGKWLDEMSSNLVERCFIGKRMFW